MTCTLKLLFTFFLCLFLSFGLLRYSVQPATLVRIPTDEAKFADRHRVDYKQWCEGIDVKVHPKNKMQEMLHAFKLFNHTIRGKRCKHVDGELIVDDNGLVLKSDLAYVLSPINVFLL